MGRFMAAVFGPPGSTLSRSALVNDPFDREAFEDVLPRAPGLRLLLESSKDPGTKDLAFDLFCSFYKYFVKLLPGDLEGAVELVAAWSAGPGEETRLPPAVKLQLMRNLVRNPRLRRIARLFGRYRRMGLADREAKALLASEEVVDFVQGGEVARALAAELANFAMREREDLFYSKVVQHQLLTYELWQLHERPRPVYLCLDNSGSMSGEKEVWAKASALALAHMALQHGRSVEIVLFGDAADPLRVVSLDPRDKGPIRLEKVLDVASYFLGGGTDFQKPLSHVLDTILAGHEASGNDLLFVSDGLCPLPEAFVRRFLEAKGRHNIRLTTVVIGR